MKLAAPPSRYRIFEKDRRLVVIDTKTGQRNASAELPTIGDHGRREPLSAAPPRETSTPHTKRRPDGVPAPIAANQAKLIALVIVSLATIAVLLLSGLWIAVVIALLIPQVRTPLLEAGRKAFKTWFLT